MIRRVDNVRGRSCPVLLFAVSLVLCAGYAGAESPEEKGLAIAREAQRRDDGFGDTTSRMVMTLRNRHGDESVRKIRIRTLEVPDDGDKTLIVFDNPRDVKGTALLTHSHKKGDDDQWLFLPALKRVKRISSRNKSGSFMGSEFSYEDIASQEVEKYTYRWIRDEVLDGLPCYVSERRPVDARNSGYSRQVTWVDKAEYRVRRVEYFDRKNAHMKTLTFANYKKFLDRYWRAHDLEMENLVTGKSTHLTFSDFRFRTGLRAADFTKQALKRVR